MRPVERRARRRQAAARPRPVAHDGVLQAPGHPSDGPGARQVDQRRVLDVGDRRGQRAQDTQRVARWRRARRGRASPRRRRRRPRRRPSVPSCGGQLAALRREVEQQAHDLRARQPVDDGVVDLREHRRVPGAQAVDEVQLPQRPRAVQRPGDDARDLRGELRVGAGPGEGELAHVVVEVEVVVVDPVGVVEAERHLGQAPAQRRQQRQALGQQPLDVGAPRASRRAPSTGRGSPAPRRARSAGAFSRARNCASRLVSWRMAGAYAPGDAGISAAVRNPRSRG